MIFIELLVCLVPLDTLVKRDTRTTKDVQRTPNGQVKLALAASVHFLQVLQMTSTASVGHGYGAPLGQLGHQILVNTLLQSLHVGSVYQELRTIRFQEGDRFFMTFNWLTGAIELGMGSSYLG